MKKLELIKTIIREDINNHRALVRNACDNEIFCFKKYLEQRKEQLEKLPEDRLEGLAKGALAKAA